MSRGGRVKAKAVVLLLAMALAGCQGEQQATSTVLTVAAAGGDGEIRALREVADAFEAANPGTTVRLDTVAEAGELVSKLTVALAAKSPPDVFVMNYRRLGSFAAKGVMEPVPADSATGLHPKPLEAFTFAGSLLCLPSNAASMVVYVNPSLFTRVAVALPPGRWSWDELLATAKQLKSKGVTAIGFEPSLIRLAPFVWSNGGELVDSVDEPTSVDLRSAEAREAIGFLLELQKQGMGAAARAAQDPEEAFAAGRVAMYFDSRRAVPGFRKTEGLDFDVRPVPTKVSAVSVLHSDGYCVTKAGPRRALAQAFADFAVTGPGAEVLARSGRTVPVKTALASAPGFRSGRPASSQVFLDQLDAARSLPNAPRWNEAEGAADELLAQLFAGRLSVGQAVEAIEEATRAKLGNR
jgi:multiple sugar transport system substrate-binding protein